MPVRVEFGNVPAFFLYVTKLAVRKESTKPDLLVCYLLIRILAAHGSLIGRPSSYLGCTRAAFRNPEIFKNTGIRPLLFLKFWRL